MRKSFLVLLLLAPVLGAAEYDTRFWSHWSDGKAELTSYDVVFPRYGEPRRGTAVLIFVTEPFSNAARVKADPGKHTDEFPVMKLNAVLDFPTGIYDYNLMTSVFLGLRPFGRRPAGTPAKIAFSSQEWCGLTHAQVLFRDKSADAQWHSYFDGEADGAVSLPIPADGVSEDALFLWARGWAEPRLEPGETREVPLLMSLTTSRLKHQPLSWTKAQLSRKEQPGAVAVPAGPFKVYTWTAAVVGGPVWTFDVEAAFPHRIVRWSTSDGQKGEMIKSERLKYWEMNGAAFENAVERLGLRPRPRRTP